MFFDYAKRYWEQNLYLAHIQCRLVRIKGGLLETFFWEQTTCTINLKINENSVVLIHISKVVIVFNYARKRFYCWPVHEDCGILLLIFWAVKKLDFRKTFFFNHLVHFNLNTKRETEMRSGDDDFNSKRYSTSDREI